MYISYFDEAGDDGFPSYTSPLFTLSCIYFHYEKWQENYQKIVEIRKNLKSVLGFPVKLEMHTRNFLLNKKPYDGLLKMKDSQRVTALDYFIHCLPNLDMKAINVVINKTVIKSKSYNVLDTALTYSIQRVENDLSKIDLNSRFLIITDQGRVGKMRRTSRKIQKINFIPSKFSPSSYRQEIKLLIEDPLPKESDQSYFIQVSDVISFVVYHYQRICLGIGNFPSRLPKEIDKAKIFEWMGILSAKFNVKAHENDQFGVVCYPK